MHPYRRLAEKRQSHEASNEVKLRCLPPIKPHIKCVLTGASMKQESLTPINPQAELKPEVELIPMVIVTKCPCCDVTTSTDTVLINALESEFYFHTFVQNNVPGIIKYVPCTKCSSVKLALVK
jgi:hypothetical protein